MAEVSSSASPWAWAALSLWVAAGILLVFAAVAALPMGFESSPGDRAAAVEPRWLTVLVLTVGGFVAGVAGVGCLRRAPRRATV